MLKSGDENKWRERGWGKGSVERSLSSFSESESRWKKEWEGRRVLVRRSAKILLVGEDMVDTSENHERSSVVKLHPKAHHHIRCPDVKIEFLQHVL